MPIRIFRTSFFFALTITILWNALFLFVFFYLRNAVMPAGGKHDFPQFHVMPLIFGLISHFVQSFILYITNFKLLTMDFKPKMRILLQIVFTFAIAFLLSYLFSNIQDYFRDFDFSQDPRPRNFGSMMRDFFIALIVLLTSMLYYLSKKQQQTALENRTLMAENMRTRYEALKNQVDPHFLFNSLNTLNALIKIDADKAQQYVQQLSYVFRYTLQNKEVISLEEELKFTQAYCHLMQIRYGDCLRFEYQIDPRFHNYTIISLSLQTLVENAIKHNVVTAKQPLTISFATTEKGTVSVSNPIQLKKESESGEGIGLANLSERYRLMWQQGILVTRNDGVFRVEIVLLNG